MSDRKRKIGLSNPKESARKRQKQTATVDTDGPSNPTRANSEELENIEGSIKDSSQDANGADNVKEKKTKNPPIKDAWLPYTPPQVDRPVLEAHWGVKPLSTDPPPHPEQPPIRDGDHNTNPPLWEDRGYNYSRGSRYVKYFGTIEPEFVDEDGPDLDQLELLHLKLMDMRPDVNNGGQPSRIPDVWWPGRNGEPKDWNNSQAIKCLNDRRIRALEKVACDRPWTWQEREFIRDRLQETPEISLWNLTQLLNDKFLGQLLDEDDEEVVLLQEPEPGRTVEDVRYEYRTWKREYDHGNVPVDRRQQDEEKKRTERADKERRRQRLVFGTPEQSEDEGEANQYVPRRSKLTSRKKATSRKRAAPKSNPKKRSATAIKNGADSEKDQAATAQKRRKLKQSGSQGETDPPLTDLDEELLDLAGANSPWAVRTSPTPEFSQRSWFTIEESDSDLSDATDCSALTDFKDGAIERRARARAPSPSPNSGEAFARTRSLDPVSPVAAPRVRVWLPSASHHVPSRQTHSPSPVPTRSPASRAMRDIQVDENYSEEEDNSKEDDSSQEDKNRGEDTDNEAIDSTEDDETNQEVDISEEDESVGAPPPDSVG